MSHLSASRREVHFFPLSVGFLFEKPSLGFMNHLNDNLGNASFFQPLRFFVFRHVNVNESSEFQIAGVIYGVLGATKEDIVGVNDQGEGRW